MTDARNDDLGDQPFTAPHSQAESSQETVVGADPDIATPPVRTDVDATDESVDETKR